MGQIFAGESIRGAFILIVVIIVGNLNAIWLSVFDASEAITETFMNHTLPVLLYDIFAFYGLISWIW